jgi:hypothetical protein
MPARPGDSCERLWRPEPGSHRCAGKPPAARGRARPDRRARCRNAAFARKWADAVQLGKLEVLNGDASIADSYQGLPPADAVVVSGVFGHLSNTDRVGLISFLRQICRNGGCVVWTFFNWDTDESDKLRGYFREQLFNEESLEVLPGKFSFVVARYRYAGAPVPFEPHAKIFTFGSSREGGETAAS